jgi:RNA-directed DNA polymerase
MGIFTQHMQFSLFEPVDKDQLLIELFQAYFDARKNKRNTINALVFEKHFEENIFQLFDEIINDRYEPRPCICFIVTKPVLREIFAADFRDRVIHHFIINKINTSLDRTFIHDCYACRIGKGTHFGIRRVTGFINSCSCNYTIDCYILKLDIQGFFMHINRDILFKRLKRFLFARHHEPDADLILKLCQTVIFKDPTKNCIIKGSKRDWYELPANKSLFHSPEGCGLPIGNLTSQVLANLYLSDFDHFMKHTLRLKYYGRYVDDFVIIHRDKSRLLQIIPLISDYLQQNLGLTLHPSKIYLQHFSKGVQFLGTVIKPHRIYIANRTKGNFYQAIQRQNAKISEHKPNEEDVHLFQSTINSYLGILGHYKTYKIRKRYLEKNLSGDWLENFCISPEYNKLAIMGKV